MPNNLEKLENIIVSGTKDKKSSDKKSSDKKSSGKKSSAKCKKPTCSSSSSSACTETCIDCCTPQFIRLTKFSTTVSVFLVANLGVNTNTNGNTGSNDRNDLMNYSYNRCGDLIAPPNTSSASQNLITYPNNGNTGAYWSNSNSSEFCPASNFVNLDTNITIGSTPDTVGVTGTTTTAYLNPIALFSYYFVNKFQYITNEPGCKSDQVYGWYVDISNGNLQLYSQYESVPTNISLNCLQATANINITSTEKKQLKTLNSLYKLSKTAIKKVNGVPSEEGNIVQVCDCHGNQWLVYINLANNFNVNVLCSNTQFTIVACKL